MFKLRDPRVAIGVMWAAGALLLAFPESVFAGGPAGQAPAAVHDRGDDVDEVSPNETPAELFMDGMDAAADHAMDSARRLFRQLIALFPGSPEADRAKRALGALNENPDAVVLDHEAIRADEAQRTAEYRRTFLIDVGDRVFFAESSATIGGRARSMIDSQARWLKARPELTVTVIGRADDGDRNSARTLSRERAEAVRERLVAAGLDRNRIDIKATGDQDKLALCATALCQAQNRNVEILINDWRDGGAMQLGQQAPEPVAPASSRSAVDQVSQ